MKQLSSGRMVLYHLYPGVLITLVYVLLAPFVMQHGYPPQMAILLSIVLVAVPVMAIHLLVAKKAAASSHISALFEYKPTLTNGKLALWSSLLVVIAFVVWGATQPLSVWITAHWLQWLPSWYNVQSFTGYAPEKIKQVLLLNIVLNGLLAPAIEELYFRGYLLPRMEKYGKAAVILNTALFTLYHFWQPYIYLTLFLALLPMVFLTWKTKDLRLSILMHICLNLIGALATYGALNK